MLTVKERLIKKIMNILEDFILIKKSVSIIILDDKSAIKLSRSLYNNFIKGLLEQALKTIPCHKALKITLKISKSLTSVFSSLWVLVEKKALGYKFSLIWKCIVPFNVYNKHEKL